MKFKIQEHEVNTKGSFALEDGSYVSGQRHTLQTTIYQASFSDIKEMYEEGLTRTEVLEEIISLCDIYDREIDDEFFLTGYEEGFRYEHEDIVEYFNDEWPEYDWNGYSSDWSDGSWEEYKNQFPKLTEKSQFDHYRYENGGIVQLS